MSKEQITCGDCGYVYHGCTAVDHCPKCEEDVALEQQVKVLKGQKAKLVEALEEIASTKTLDENDYHYCGTCVDLVATASRTLKEVG